MATEKSDVGTYDITIAKGTVMNKNVTFVNGKLTVSKAPLTVSAGDYTMRELDALPTFKATYSGFKNGETESVLIMQPTLTTTATSNSLPGKYTVSAIGAIAQNYNIIYIEGTLTIIRVAPEAVNNLVPLNNGYVFVCDELSGRPGKEVLFGDNHFLDLRGGSCATNKGGVDLSIAGGNEGYVTEEIAVKYGKKYAGIHRNYLRLKGMQDMIALRLSAKSKIIIFEQGNNRSGTDARIPRISKNPDLSESLNTPPDVNHPATISGYRWEFMVEDDGVYYLGSYNGDIYVSFIIVETDEPVAPVVITANSYTRAYGETNPTFEFTSEGAALIGLPEISCDATVMSPVGTYPIIVSMGSVKNLNDSYVNGTLTITKAPLTISAGDYTMKWGDALPTFRVTYSGFKNNETETVLTKKPILTTTATSNRALRLRTMRSVMSQEH